MAHKTAGNLVDYSCCSDTDGDSPDESDKEKEESEDAHFILHTSGPPPTEAEIVAELDKINSQRKETRRSAATVSGTLSEIRKKRALIQGEEKALRSDIRAICIQGRNDHSKRDLKRDFTKGIRE